MAKAKGGDLRAFYWVLGATAVIAVAALAWSSLGGGVRSTATQPILSIVEREIEGLEWLAATATGVERGDPNAPITILEFGDFQCPACQQFATFVKPQIDLAYVEAGVARFVFHDFPIVSGHPYSFLASRRRVARSIRGISTSGPSTINSSRTSRRGLPARAPPGTPLKTMLPRSVSMWTTLPAVLGSDRHAEVVSANMRLGMELGVSGTPTIFVSKGGGTGVRVVRWSEFERFKSVIDRLLEEDEGGGA